MLLYGLNLTRLLVITSNLLRQRSGDTYLMLGDHELLLPPILADLLMQLPCPARRSTLPDIESEHRLPLPGRTPPPIDAFTQGPQHDLTLAEFADGAQYLCGIAAQAVDTYYDDGIALCRVVEQCGQSRDAARASRCQTTCPSRRAHEASI
jgi:hypothetical protein